jgi:hypothetical protein
VYGRVLPPPACMGLPAAGAERCAEQGGVRARGYIRRAGCVVLAVRRWTEMDACSSQPIPQTEPADTQTALPGPVTAARLLLPLGQRTYGTYYGK